MPMLFAQHGHIKEFYNGDPYENRTRVTAVKGPCLNRLTNGPIYTSNPARDRIHMVAVGGFEPPTLRV